jgi:hypothetical protein
MANIVILVDVSRNPMYNAMDKYNTVSGVVNDIDKRLETLENKFTYHIQSTDELKPKA